MTLLLNALRVSNENDTACIRRVREKNGREVGGNLVQIPHPETVLGEEIKFKAGCSSH